MPTIRRFRSSRDALSRPRTGVIISGVRSDFSSESARWGLDPERLGRAYRAADSGDTLALMQIFSGVEEDAHVTAVLGKRRRAVTSRTLGITPYKLPGADEDTVSEPARKAAELCNSVIFGDDRGGGIADWTQALFDITDAIGKGYSLQQIVWANVRDSFRPVKLEYWPQAETLVGDTEDPHGQHSERVRVIVDTNMHHGIDLAPWQWVLHRHKSRSAPLGKSALLRSVAWWTLFKTFSAKDWTIFCERYGMPTRLGKYPHGSGDESRVALEEAVINLGREAGAVIEEGSSVEFVQAAISGELPYERLVRTCDTQISKAIMGNTLTTEVGDTGGNRALGEVHERTELDLVESDAVRVATTIREQILAPVVLFNLGADVPVPLVDFLSEEDRTQLDRAKRDEILARSIGLPMGQSYFYEQYEVRPPQEGEELVNPPQDRITSTEDLPDDDDGGTAPDATNEVPDADEVEAEIAEAASAAGINGDDIAALRRVARTSGRSVAHGWLSALQSVKKKSTAWAM